MQTDRVAPVLSVSLSPGLRVISPWSASAVLRAAGECRIGYRKRRMMDLLDPDLLMRDLVHGGIRGVTAALITRLLSVRRHNADDPRRADAHDEEEDSGRPEQRTSKRQS